MAIIKQIELGNGVNVNYHRVVSVNNITNVSSIIEIASYTSESKREEEKNAIKNREEMNVFISSRYINLPYDAEMDAVKAYNYLKTLDEFENAKDI